MIQVQISNLTTSVQSVQVALSDVNNKINAISDDVTILKDRLTAVEDRQETLHLDSEYIEELHGRMSDRVNEVEDEIDKLEQYSRRENVLLHGVEMSDNENYDTMRQKVANLLNNKLNTNKWKDSCILRAHRLGKFKDGHPPPIISPG